MKRRAPVKLFCTLSIYLILVSCERDQAYIEITWPGEDLLWFNNKDYKIKWNDNIDGNVNIELLRDNRKVTDIEANATNSGQYNWLIRNIETGEGYYIRVVSVADSTVFGESSRIEIGRGIMSVPYSNYNVEDLVIGDKSLQLYTGGEGKTTIVFEHGLGGDASVWFENMLLGAVAKGKRIYCI